MLRFPQARTIVLGAAALSLAALACSSETGAETESEGGAALDPRDDGASDGEGESEREGALALEEEAPAWSVTGNMTQARQLFVSTLLPDGQVLVAGGWRVGAIDTGNVYFSSAELFDPGFGAFTLLSSKMSQKRVLHAAVLFGGGSKVLVVGGYGDAVSATTSEVYRVTNQKFEAQATLAHQRVAATATLLEDGRVLAVGGDEAPGRTAELFSPSFQTWSQTAGLMVARRRDHTATLLPGGRVLVAGGRPEDGAPPLATAEVFEPSSGTWKAVASMAVARRSHTATLLDSGLVLVAGGFTEPPGADLGASAEVYDPIADVWTPVAPMAEARAAHTATRLANGAVLVTGGVDETSSSLRSTELFDPGTAQWVPAGLMSHARLSHTAVVLADGALLAAGGEHQSSAEIYRAGANGRTCAVASQCASGHCVEGVCCETACQDLCVTCALPGLEGTCAPAAPGTDPQLDCGAGGPCDDVCGEGGTCVDRVGEQCVAPSCDEDGTRANLSATCSAPGAACTQVTVECAPYRCGPIDDTGELGCQERCASIDDCAEGYACDTDGKCRARPDVAAADPEACAAAAGGPSQRGLAHGAPAPAALAAVAIAALLRRRRRPS